ncbi:MAG: isoaspartyl peptidase/L-asparaginase [Halobacteriaceae archaeon]
MKIVVHGGAGSSPDNPDQRQEVLNEAAKQGAEAKTPLDAIETAINILEASPKFNAGFGGAIQTDKTIRTDAGIMTSNREIGAVCSVEGVQETVSLARVVLEETPHILISCDSAVALAEDFDIETGIDLLTEEQRDKLAEMDIPTGSPKNQLEWISQNFGGSDTVGAVAYDGKEFAAGTSTGGRWLSLPGRVGDVPQVGAGFYASPAGAASTTGAGEDIAKVTLTRRAVGYLEDGKSAQSAAEQAIADFDDITNSTAGVIVMDANGTCGTEFNTEAMQTSQVTE